MKNILLSLKSLDVIFHRKMEQWRPVMKKLKNNSDPSRLDAFEFLCAKVKGVYVVRLRQVGYVDHASVDANNYVILDSE